MTAPLLRDQAETRLKSAPYLKKITHDDLPRDRLVHELELHEVELELQNEELRRARSEAESSRQRYADLYDEAPLAFVSLDGEGRIKEANLAAGELVGIERNVLLGKPLSAFMKTTDADAVHHLRQEVLRSRQRGAVEVNMRCRGGVFHPVHVVVTAPPSALDGECRCAMLDLHELRTANEALRVAETNSEAAQRRLRETQERFALITEHVEDVFYIVEANGAVSYVSPAFERVWGAHATFPETWPPSIHREDSAEVDAARTALRRGDPFDIDYRIRRDDGTIRWIHDRAFTIEDDDGSIARIVGVARDRTVERELELELTQAQKMEAIGSLSSGIAHDFNNVLQVVIGAMGLACDDRVPWDHAHQYLERAKAVAIRGGELVQRIAGFARKERTKPQAIVLDDALRNALTLVRPLLGEHIDIVLELDAPGATIVASHVQLEQILLNLASNSRDAMPKGGSLTIRTERTPTNGTPPRVSVAVSDDGCGMDEATQARVFDPFFTTKTPGHGTGLGLATVLAVVEQLGGRVRVASKVGRGTSVVVELPLDVASESPVTESAVRSVRGGSGARRFHGTVLLVEDEPMVRRTIRTQLEQLGFDVIEAETPERALALLADHGRSLQLVISDVLMPHMTGPQLVAKVRQTTRALPVLYISGDPGDVLDPTNLEPTTGYLAKPFEVAELAAAIAPVLEMAREEPAPPSVRTSRRAMVLVLDGHEGNRRHVKQALSRHGYRVFAAASGQEAIAIASSWLFEVLVTNPVTLTDDDRTATTRILELQPEALVVALPASADTDERGAASNVVDTSALVALLESTLAPSRAE